MNKKVLVVVICFISSFVITMQFRTISSEKKRTKSIETRINEMVLELEKEKMITEYLNERINYNIKEKEA